MNPCRPERSQGPALPVSVKRCLLILAAALVASPLFAQTQDSIAAIRANPQKYWNLEVTVAGLVGRAESSMPGGQLGTFRLVDYTDSTGIAVESEDLPAPGRVLRVHGVVVPSRDNATIPIVKERSREALDKPTWLLWVVAGAGLMAVALAGVLIYFIKRGSTPAPGVALSDAARPPVPIVIGGPVKMAPPPVYMPWAQPGARASGALMRPSFDESMAARKTPPAGAGTLPRHTPGGTPVIRPTVEMPTIASPGAAHGGRDDLRTPPSSPRILSGPGGMQFPPNQFALPPRPGTRAPAPVTQPFNPAPPRTEPFEYTGARLEVLEGPDAGRKVPIGSHVLYIGREGGRRNHLPLKDPTVSLQQAKILRDDTFGFVLENESKTNRTLLNGDIVLEPVALENGAEVRMGATLIRFLLGS